LDKLKEKEVEAYSVEVKIKNCLGLHARPSAVFVQTASKFKSDICIEKNGDIVNGKSILGLLMLAAGQGSIIKISASGADDAQSAVSALVKLVEQDCEFNEI